jgi:peptidoglycan/LPS O-acetylase OafA/YrhL
MPPMPQISVFGDLGVRTFFVISGFLITTLLLGEYEKRGRISLVDFYIRRVYRIFPAFYVYLAVLLIIAAVGWISLPPADVAFAATYTMNFHAERTWWLGHLWSLAVEEQFYLVWPLALSLLRPRRALWFAIGGIIAAPVLRCAAWVVWPSIRPLTDQAFPFVFDALATGCVLALARDWLETSPTYLAWIDSRAFWVLPLACVFALSVPRTGFNLALGVTIGNLGVAMAIHRCVRHPELPVGAGVAPAGVRRRAQLLAVSVAAAVRQPPRRFDRQLVPVPFRVCVRRRVDLVLRRRAADARTAHPAGGAQASSGGGAQRIDRRLRRAAEGRLPLAATCRRTRARS